MENKQDNIPTFDSIPFQKLAAGNKSIIAMVADLFIRFYREYEKDGLKDTRPKDFRELLSSMSWTSICIPNGCGDY